MGFPPGPGPNTGRGAPAGPLVAGRSNNRRICGADKRHIRRESGPPSPETGENAVSKFCLGCVVQTSLPVAVIGQQGAA